MSGSDERTYIVDGMSCGHCRAAVTEEVERVAGVAEIEVDLDARRVTVRGESVSDAAVRRAIEEAGYEARAA